jgi:hypothetical protein
MAPTGHIERAGPDRTSGSRPNEHDHCEKTRMSDEIDELTEVGNPDGGVVVFITD